MMKRLNGQEVEKFCNCYKFILRITIRFFKLLVEMGLEGRGVSSSAELVKI
jgi:hypothetical protein